mmetsp:Transcript_37040/g.116541  ORF Transcript_37040/g.116541 Transcript_37040/m.116541 type:complete len:92 (-) Transcript_37040:42-317(-)
MEIPEDAVDHRKKKGGITFVLDNASLEVAKVGKNYALLNCDDHANFIRRNKKDPAQYRPDILHQVRQGAPCSQPARLPRRCHGLARCGASL